LKEDKGVEAQVEELVEEEEEVEVEEEE